jgi:hypothetical protein
MTWREDSGRMGPRCGPSVAEARRLLLVNHKCVNPLFGWSMGPWESVRRQVGRGREAAGGRRDRRSGGDGRGGRSAGPSDRAPRQARREGMALGFNALVIPEHLLERERRLVREDLGRRARIARCLRHSARVAPEHQAGQGAAQAGLCSRTSAISSRPCAIESARLRLARCG